MKKEDKMQFKNINKNINRVTRFIFEGIWNISEMTGIGLGRFAPYVFGKIIGNEGKKINRKR